MVVVTQVAAVAVMQVAAVAVTEVAAVVATVVVAVATDSLCPFRGPERLSSLSKGGTLRLRQRFF